MTNPTTPQLSESDVVELIEALPHVEYQPEAEAMPLCAFCDGSIDDHKANCVVPHIHALIRDWRALKAERDAEQLDEHLRTGMKEEPKP